MHTPAITILAMSLLIVPIPPLANAFEIEGNEGSFLEAEELATFNEPWAMTFLPDGRMLVTEKSGTLLVVSADGASKQEVRNLPKVAYGGQGGLGDVVLHPDFAGNNLVYVSYVESLDGGASRGAVVIRGRLETGDQPILKNVEKIWSQKPKMRGKGHFSHRLAFGPKGSEQEGKLFITSGDRQELTPAQDFDMALGKIIRLNDDGTVPQGNPWQDKGELARSFWTTGHRNLLGIGFDSDGRLWSHEMGPRHGDELNLIIAGKNYGWPLVSNGDHYSGAEIPDHDSDPSFEAPKEFWVPSIAPSGLVIYDGEMFPDWKGDAFIGGLVSEALIHVDLEGETAGEVERFAWGKRIREVGQGPDGALYVLEDRRGGRLLRLTPAD